MSSALELIRSFRGDMVRGRELMSSGMADQARVLVEKYNGLFPKDIDLLFLRAKLAYLSETPEAAEPTLKRAMEHIPNSGELSALYANTLARLGRRAEGIATLEAFRAEDPTHSHALDQYIALILAERGLAAAIATLKREYGKASDNAKPKLAIESLRGRAMSLFELSAIAEADPGNFLQIESGSSEGYNFRAISEAFEPIGSDCEFGTVQRRAGAEPLALFRWTGVKPEDLVRLLSIGLEGYERPDIYALRTFGTGEFNLYETEFGTSSHTGVNLGDIPEEEFLTRVTRRQGFLKRKFLADLAAGEKIFLYKLNRPLTDEQMDAIESELHKLGARYCLFVTLSEDVSKGGTVAFPSESRAVAHLSATMPNIKDDEWRRILVTVYDRFRLGKQDG